MAKTERRRSPRRPPARPAQPAPAPAPVVVEPPAPVSASARRAKGSKGVRVRLSDVKLATLTVVRIGPLTKVVHVPAPGEKAKTGMVRVHEDEPTAVAAFDQIVAEAKQGGWTVVALSRPLSSAFDTLPVAVK